LAAFFSCLALTIMMAAGAAHAAKEKAPKIKDFDALPGEPGGYLTGSLAVVSKGPMATNNSSHTIYFRKVGSDGARYQSIGRGGFSRRKSDFTSKRLHSRTFMYRFEPGEYEIYAVRFYYNGAGIVADHNYASDEFTIPFEIKDGEATYIGNFLAYFRKLRRGEAWEEAFGFRGNSGSLFVYSNQAERDLPTLREKYPELADVPFAVVEHEYLYPPMIDYVERSRERGLLELTDDEIAIVP
ncbi:MAG: hypothetical protein AAFX85_14275, partial [Pseudomonadota bacterium]